MRLRLRIASEDAARRLYLMKEGIAIAARMPMMNTTPTSAATTPMTRPTPLLPDGGYA
jgi:hypothetical protein